MSNQDHKGLTQLGQRTSIPASPHDAVIETFQSAVGRPVCVRFTCPEFTSLCPLTGQPDFARIVIDYVPAAVMVESKSLKLFLSSFRNEGSFHERVVDTIGERLSSALSPAWLRVVGIFAPRGGIPIDVFWQDGEVPRGVHVPELDLGHYRAR